MDFYIRRVYTLACEKCTLLKFLIGFTFSPSYLYYQERPLNTSDWSNGTMLPLNVRVLLLKFGFTVTVALLPPLVNEINIWAEIPMPCTLNEQFTFPFLSVVIFISDNISGADGSFEGMRQFIADPECIGRGHE